MVYNPNNFALTLSTDPVAWSDTLPAGLSFASPANASTTCGGTITMVGRTLSLLGGSVPAKSGRISGSSTVSVNVTSTTAGNHENIIPANSLKASDPTGTISVSNTTSSSATLQVTVIPDESHPVVMNASGFSINFGTLTPGKKFSITVLGLINTSASAPGVITNLPPRPAGAAEQSPGLEIEIPGLGIRTTIVGLEKNGASWDITWLGGQLGYLNGTAYPTLWRPSSICSRASRKARRIIQRHQYRSIILRWH